MDVVVVPKRGIVVKELHLDNLSRELLPVLHRAATHVTRMHARTGPGSPESPEPRPNGAHAATTGTAMPDKTLEAH